jgi:hypothetical protein
MRAEVAGQEISRLHWLPWILWLPRLKVKDQILVNMLYDLNYEFYN